MALSTLHPFGKEPADSVCEKPRKKKVIGRSRRLSHSYWEVGT